MTLQKLAPSLWLAFAAAFLTAQAGAERYAPFADPSFPFVGLSVDASPEGEHRTNWVPRGVVVRLGEDLWALYDVDLVRLAAVWRGSFPEGKTIAQLSYQDTKVKAGGGQKDVPRFEGALLYSTPMLPGMWTGDDAPTDDPRDKGADGKELGRGPVDFGKYARWRGIEVDRLERRDYKIHYEAGGGKVTERIEVSADGSSAWRYMFSSDLKKPVTVATRDGGAFTLSPDVAGEWKREILWGGDNKPESPHRERAPGARAVAVKVQRGQGGRDRIPLPLDNSFKRPVRPTAIAFYKSGRAAVTTIDGDVWTATGLNADTGVRWRRFATGLHEPYSAVIRDGELFVFDRGGLKRLHDRDDDGEADYHEWFCHDFWQSAETRDFPHDMALRADGGFYLAKGGQQNDHLSKHSGRILSVSADGSDVEVFSSGHRNVFFGLNRSTGDLVGVDQQGHWVPSTPVQEFRKGGYYGFQPAAPQGVPEPPVEKPLLWIAHRAAQSAVDVIAGGREEDGLILVDYFRPGLLKVLPGGGAVRLGGEWDFPLLKGAVNPADGHLYLVGFQIWGSAAKELTGFGRLRSDAPERAEAPVRVRPGKAGVVIEFAFSIGPAAADLGRYYAASWNYERSSEYGSGYYRADGSAGQDPLAVAGAHVSKDGRKLFLHLPELAVADQVEIGYRVPREGGGDVSEQLYLTPSAPGDLDLGGLGFAPIDLLAEAAAARATKVPGEGVVASVARGEKLSLTFGCIACHSTDGTTEGKSGPTWKGLHGARREFLEGAPLESADGAYLREAILDPVKRVVKGYDPKDVGMPSYRGILSDADVESLLLYIESLGG